MSTYSRIHETLRREIGPASQFTCDCGQPALEWAYQFTGNPELQDENGRGPHSLDPADYAPMCRPCHLAFDVEHDPTIADKQRESGRRNAATRVERMRADPAFDKRIRETNSQNGVATTSIYRRCLECDKEGNPGVIGRHQKSSGHQGWTQEGEQK